MPRIFGQRRSDSPLENTRRNINPGTANGILIENVPCIETSPCETKYEGMNNSFIILGRDRPGNIGTGYGAKGYSEAGRIDLIAGLQSAAPGGPSSSDNFASPDFSQDAARVYISQKADIDKYMGIADTSPAAGSTARSAIGMKADCIRMHARRNIKIVTGRARLPDQGSDGERLSTGGVNQTTGTISFIAGNYTKEELGFAVNVFNPLAKLRKKRNKLQPLVRGDQMVDCVEEMLNMMRDIVTAIQSNQRNIGILNKSLVAHGHPVGAIGPAPFAMPQSTHSIAAFPLEAIDMAPKADNKIFKKKAEAFKKNYLNKLSGNYINSKFVFTT